MHTTCAFDSMAVWVHAFGARQSTMHTRRAFDSMAVCYAEQGRLHAARSLASGLAQFINTTATTLVHHGTINAELQDACQSAFKR